MQSNKTVGRVQDGGLAAGTRVGELMTPGAPADTSSSPSLLPSAEERHARIAREAYLRAEQRGFEPGKEVDDWLAAERQVDKLPEATRDPRRPENYSI